MSTPSAPDDTAKQARLERIVGKAVKDILRRNESTRTELIGYTAIAAYLEAIRGVVVSTDDLRAVLEDWWEAGHDAPPVLTSEGVKPYWGEYEQAIYDRLRAKVGGE